MGQRILEFNCEVLTSICRWPFEGKGAAISVVDNKLPPDARFVRVYRAMGPMVYLVVASDLWEGDVLDSKLPAPVFAIHGEAPKPKLPTVDDLAAAGRN